jgi:hypothetical protein
METNYITEGKEKRGKGIRRTIGIVGLAAVAVLAFAAYKYLTNRPGEAAIKYIPADAAMVATFDGTPSEKQLLAFAKIQHAMGSEGIGDLTASSLSDAFNKNPLAKEVQPYVTKNFALAMWTSQKFQKNEGAIFFSLTDPSAVQGILAKDCKAGPESGLYTLPAIQQGVLGVIGNYLVYASSQPRFDQILKVSKGELPSVVTLSAYTAARAALPSDSNLMCFVSPDVYKQMLALSKQPAMTSAEWFSIGAAVRDNGLAIVCRTPETQEGLDLTPKLDMAILNKLPAGAIGIMAVTDPGAWYTAYAKQQQGPNPLDESLSKMKEKNGIDPLKDVLLKLSGNCQFAVYPGKTPTFLLYSDSANGEDAMGVVNTIVNAVQAHPAAWGNTTVTKSQVGEATIWKVKPGASAQPAMRGQPQTAGPNPTDPWSVVSLHGAVYVVSSDDMATQVMALGTGGKTLAQDPAFLAMERRIAPNAQSAMMISIRRIFQALNHGKDSPYEAIFGAGEPGVVGYSHFDNKTGVGDLFIPLDWDKAIHYLGGAMKSSQGHGTPATATTNMS